MKKSLARKIMFIVSASLLGAALAAFLIIGFVNFPLISGLTSVNYFRNYLLGIWDEFVGLFTYASGNIIFEISCLVVFGLCVGLAITLWIVGIVRKKLHYLFSGLFLVLGGAVFELFSIAHLAEVGKNQPVVGRIVYYAGLVGGLCLIAFAFVDIFAKGKEVAPKAVKAEPVTKVEKVKVEPKPVNKKEAKKEVKVVEAPKKETKKAPKAEEKVEDKPTKKAPAKAPNKKETKKPEPKAEVKTTKVETKPAKTTKKTTKAAAPVETVKEEKEGPSKMYHISRREDLNKWQVKLEGGDKAVKLFNTQAEALAYAKEKGNVKLHSKAGKIRKA